MTQQYTCPFCLKNYVKATIHEHYECGVEPEEEAPKYYELTDRAVDVFKAQAEAEKIISEAMEEAKRIKEQAQSSEPKKRGPKPKNKPESE